jgi:hypothetical protein
MSSADCKDILIFFNDQEKSNLESLKNKWTTYRVQHESGWLFEPDETMMKKFAYQKYLIEKGLRSDNIENDKNL